MTNTNYLPADEVHRRVAAKGTRFMTVRFIKKNGELRTINGLTKPTSKILGTGRKTPEHLIAIWSPRDGWRSFSVDSVVEIR